VPFHKSIELNGHSVSIGIARFDCLEVLFDPSKAVSPSKHRLLSLPDLVYTVLQSAVPQEKRASLFGNIIFTGLSSQTANLKERLAAELAALAATSDYSSDCQPRHCRFLKIPEFFTPFKDQLHFATWIGGSITAKMNSLDFRAFLEIARASSGDRSTKRKEWQP
jgi:actin-related protein